MTTIENNLFLEAFSQVFKKKYVLYWVSKNISIPLVSEALKSIDLQGNYDIF